MADKVLQSILAAGFPEDVFGALPGDKAKQLHDLKAVFRQLVQVIWMRAVGEADFLELLAEWAGAPVKIKGRGASWEDWSRC